MYECVHQGIYAYIAVRRLQCCSLCINVMHRTCMFVGFGNCWPNQGTLALTHPLTYSLTQSVGRFHTDLSPFLDLAVQWLIPYPRSNMWHSTYRFPFSMGVLTLHVLYACVPLPRQRCFQLYLWSVLLRMCNFLEHLLQTWLGFYGKVLRISTFMAVVKFRIRLLFQFSAGRIYVSCCFLDATIIIRTHICVCGYVCVVMWMCVWLCVWLFAVERRCPLRARRRNEWCW